jgi:hypothetical protein
MMMGNVRMPHAPMILLGVALFVLSKAGLVAP